MKINYGTKFMAFLIFVLAVIGYSIMKWYPDLLWFQSLHYDHIWWFVIKAKAILFFSAFAIALLWLALHSVIAYRLAFNKTEAQTNPPREGDPMSFAQAFFSQFSDSLSVAWEWGRFINKMLLTVGTVAVAGLFGLTAMASWDKWYLFINQVPHTMIDPIFKKNLAFYFFTYPLLKHIQLWSLWLVLITLAAVLWLYITSNKLIWSKTQQINSQIKAHLFGLLSALFIAMAFNLWINRFELLYSPRGIVFGAGYTDVFADLLCYNVLMVLCLIQAVIFLVWAWRKKNTIPVAFLGMIVVTYIVLGHIYPGIVQNYFVSPNEITKERPYIENNIQYTRKAYNLDRVEEQEFPVSNRLTFSDIQKNANLIQNITLWDPIPIKQTFSQLQEIRLYYKFSNIDIDRYLIDGKLKQVLLSPRELQTEQNTQIPQTWINRHLVYTHGYGLCMSPVSFVTPEGLPHFYIQDIPPVSEMGIEVKQPALYFGERTNDYVILNTKEKEFDYPKGDDNAYTFYQGQGGIIMNTLFKRFLFAMKFSEIKIFISDYITSQSRIMYDRNIITIVEKIAPFLIYDQDPYLVLSKDGRLKWMLDAYTYSGNFPYSDPIQSRINYIRNTVKVVIDAYSGETTFYVMDPTEPFIATYQKIYANMFKPFSEMPDDLKQHIRYPKTLFMIQAQMLRTYHMTDPRVFYNREDMWSLPKEKYEDSEQDLQAYYMITRIPGESHESFAVMLPFTPVNKNNMIAWMAAKCDLKDYGALKLFKFPKERTIYGPMQIESRIDQDTEISQKLTLWGQMGSRVLRGNMMVIPIEQALVYVEPIYLQATQSKMPELKRVIFAYNDKIVMADTLDQAIAAVFLNAPISESRTKNKDGSKPTAANGLNQMINQLSNEYRNVREAMRKAEWNGFGAAMQRLDQAIEQLVKSQR